MKTPTSFISSDLGIYKRGVAGNEEPTRLSPLPGDMDVQIEQVLGYLKEKLTELERFVYLIRLCDRNEALFYKVLTSDRMRFLLASDTRRNLLEIWLSRLGKIKLASVPNS